MDMIEKLAETFDLENPEEEAEATPDVVAAALSAITDKLDSILALLSAPAAEEPAAEETSTEEESSDE